MHGVRPFFLVRSVTALARIQLGRKLEAGVTQLALLGTGVAAQLFCVALRPDGVGKQRQTQGASTCD